MSVATKAISMLSTTASPMPSGLEGMQPVAEGELLELVDVPGLAAVVEAHQHDDRNGHERVDEDQQTEPEDQVLAHPPADSLGTGSYEILRPSRADVHEHCATMMTMSVTDIAPAAA